MAWKIVLFEFTMLLLILPTISESYNTGTNRRTRTRMVLPGSGSAKPINPLHGRRRKSDSRHSHKTAAKIVTEERINEMTLAFKANVERLKRKDKLDLLFLIDESSSVGLPNFMDEIKFVSRFVSGIEVDMNHTRVAVVTFSDNITTWVNQVSMGEVHAHKCSLLGQDLPAIRYKEGGTFTKGALMNAETILENARFNSTKVIFLITDGNSNAGDPRPLASALKRQGIELFTFGIREGNKQELSYIASKPTKGHCLILNSFKEFDMVARRALHSDLESGSYIIEDSSHCDKYCTDTNCCHVTADCSCGTSTGRYECLCKPGYYGAAVKEDGCYPCPVGTYKVESLPGDAESCTPCPDPRMTSPEASTSFDQCTCAEGFNKEDEVCEPIRCEGIDPPPNGHFLACDGVYKATCTVACDEGYDLQGTATILCHGDGIWKTLDGSERVVASCQVRYCSALDPPEFGSMSCSSEDNSFATTCEFQCNEGYSLRGTNSRKCGADRQWTGSDVECREITCPAITKPDHGLLEGDCNHSNKSKYGDKCSFVCPHEGYNLVLPKTVTCSGTGYWFPRIANEDLLICNDTSPPVIVCPPDITIPTIMRKPYAGVTWKVPVATDNSERVTVTPEWTFPVPLRIGSHELTYTAEDDSGLQTKCKFTVTVQDLEPPMIDYCRGPQPVVISKGETEASHVHWNQPTFSDNSGKVSVVQNATDETFPLGVSKVEYVATDAAGNQRKCTIDISVQNNSCPRLEEPRHGHIDCFMSATGTECEMICDSEWFGFAMYEYGNPLYICEEGSDAWLPESTIPMDCSKERYSSEVLKDYQAMYDMATLNACNDTNFIASVKRTFTAIFSEKVPEWCEEQGWFQCIMIDIKVKCVYLQVSDEEDHDHDHSEYIDQGDVVDDYYYGDNLEDRRRRKRSSPRSKKHLAHRRFKANSKRLLKRHKRSEAYPDDYSEDEYDYDTDSYDGDYPEEGESDYPDEYIGGGGGETIPDTTLAEIDSTDDPDEYGSEEKPPKINGAVEGSLTEDIPLHVLNKVKEGESVQALEVTVTIRGEVDLPGNSIKEDRRLHSRMVEFIRNLKKKEEFDTAESVLINIVNSTLEEYISYQKDSYVDTDTELICPIGTVPKSKAFCVNCPVGTYYAVEKAFCVSCPIGYYQDNEAQLSCQPCPAKTSTENIHARDMTECKDLCSPGFYSEYGIEVCKSCPKDTFTDFYGATECADCAPGMGTVGRATHSADDCGELCKPGFVSIDGFIPCQKCPTGSFQNEYGKTFCYICPGNEDKHMDDFITCEDVDSEDILDLDALYFNECFAEPCKNNATCRGLGTTFSCSCLPGYQGELCAEDIDECLSNPCFETATCVDLVNEFRCECSPGYEGVLCDMEIDECATSECINGGTCVDLFNAFRCDCDSGFTGTLCEIDIDECSSSPCQNDGTCVDQVAGFICNCAIGFEGIMCQTNIDDCADDPCFNDAACVDKINEFECVCKPGFTGELCVENINECASDPCINGECLDLVNSYKCLCPPTYIGEHCDEVGDPYFDLYFGKPNTYHHAKLSYALGNMTEVTVSFYMKSNFTDTYGTPFSYAVGDGVDADTLVLTDLTALTLYVNGEFVVSDTKPINDGKWYLVTVVWTSEGGKWFIYLNGHLEDSGEGLATGETIPGGGTLIIGQEQDKLGGGFSASQEFLGTISHFNIHDYAFTASQVLLLARNCAGRQGNVRAWPEIGDGIIGNIERRPTKFCHPCPTIESDAGMVVDHVNDYSIDVDCNKGHQMVFKTKRRLTKYPFRCASDGFWKYRGRAAGVEEIKCLRVSCPTLEEIHLGNLELEGTKYGDVATYTCIEGYQVIGIKKRKCQANEKWYGEVPSCADVDECLLSDSCHVKANCTNSIGSYSCECIYGFKGDGHNCKEIYCGGAGMLQFGSISGHNFKLGGVVQYACDYGFRLEGASNRTCQTDDTWSGEMPVCVKVECAEPLNVRHSTKKPEEALRNYKSQITYICYAGYYIIGNETRECGPDSQWTGELPRCERVSCPDPPVVANSVSINNGGIKFEDIVEYSCEKKYNQLGDDQLRCNADQIWEAPNNRFPVCEHPTCEKPPSIINGEFEISQFGESTITGATYTFATEVTYSCSIGYNLVGDSVLTCIEEGLWDKLIPGCDIVSCGPPPAVENADQEHNGVLYGDLATYMCRPGYVMEGAAALTCLASSKWTDEKRITPACNPRSCGDPNDVSHSQLELTEADGYVYKAVVKFECDLGYSPSGTDTIRCNTEGEWVPEQNFLCTLVTCNDPDQPEHGILVQSFFSFFTTYDYNETVVYECNSGFYSKDKMGSRCTEHGTWSDPPPVCHPKRCRVPVDVDHATYKIVDGPYGAGPVFGGSLEYTCDEGYELTYGDAERECSDTTSWTGEPPICSRVICGEKPQIEFAYSKLYLYEDTKSLDILYLDKIKYFCVDGFVLNGDKVVQCTADRTFTELPQCDPVLCGEPPDVQYSTYQIQDVYAANSFHSTVTYTCENDFQISGNDTRTCDENGVWATNSPTICAPITCGDIEPVLNAIQFVSASEDDVKYPEIYKSGKYQPRSSAVTACDKGYEIEELVAYLSGDVNVAESEADPDITTKSIDKLDLLKRDRVKKILAKLKKLRSSPAAFVAGKSVSEAVDQVLPKTMFLQKCSENVGWLKAAPKCKPMLCPVPEILENGHFVYNTDPEQRPAFDSEIQYACDFGYKFSDAELIGEIRTVHCDWSDTIWNVYLTSLPECLPLPCDIPPSIEHGSFSEPNGDEFVFKDTAVYECDVGHEMTGDASLNCQSWQTWDKEPPTCTPVKCPEPIAPTNGKFGGKKWIYQSKISFKCDKGYNLNGTANLTCDADRTWSSKYPTCDPVPCGDPPEVDNSNVLATSQVYGGCAIYTCKHGFYLHGYSKLRCTSSGTWQKNLPSCNFMLCPPPAVSSHAIFADSVLSEQFSDRASGNYIYDDIVTYSCEEGYETDDIWELSATCLTGENIPNIPSCEGHIGFIDMVIAGYWSRRPPVCTAKDCGKPPVAHENGIVTGTDTTFNNTVHYTCNNGYYMTDENPTATCLSDGHWSRLESPTCYPVSCGKTIAPEHGYYIGEVYTFQQQLEYGCDEGYDLVGTQVLTCQATGNWDSKSPICEPVDCGKLPQIDHGQLEFEDTILGEEAIYSCDSGYYMKGISLFECMPSAKWSHHTPPQCLPVDCGVLKRPENGIVKASGYVYLHNATYSCLSGYYLSGNPTTNCLADATWSSSAPTCEPVDCGTPESLENTIMMINGPTTFMSTQKYVCSFGFEMKGNGTVRCKATAKWSDPPVCTRVKCPRPERPTFGIVSRKFMQLISSGIQVDYKYEDAIGYNCNQGYILTGEANSTCTAKRTWSSEPPRCVPVDCDGPPNIVHGRKSNWDSTFMNVVSYSCWTGYYLVGNISIECLHTGKWSKEPPKCEKVSCGKPPHLKYGSTEGADTPEDWTFESHFTYSCNVGYHLHGGSGAECGDDGEWIIDFNYYDDDASSYDEQTQIPVCEKIHCPPPSEIKHGFFKVKNYTYGDVVIYTCNDGYEKNGIEEQVLCSGKKTTSKGYYLGEPPECHPVSCGNPKEIDHGSVSFTDVIFESIAAYMCDEGYDMIGNIVSECMSNKRWSSFPTCTPKDCGNPSLPEHTDMFISSTLYPTVLDVQCQEGYLLTGKEHIQCTSEGTWLNEDMFICNPVLCGQPNLIDNGIFADLTGMYFSDRVVYECIAGYNIVSNEVDAVENSVTLHCQSDGTWQDGEPSCDPVKCGLPPPIENGESDKKTAVVFPQHVSYACDDGYSFGFSWFAQTEIECLASGKFSGVAPKCYPVSCGPPPTRENAVVSAESYTFRNLAQYACKYGYVMSNDEGVGETFYSQCSSSGLWDPLPPIEGCLPYECGPPLVLMNAEIPPYTRNTTFGHVYSYSCIEGHEAPENTTTVSCMRFGEWSDGPNCQPVNCGKKHCPPNAVCENTDTIYTSKFAAKCIEGYEFEPNIKEYTVECQATALWSDPTNTENFDKCVKLSCGPHPPIANGSGISDQEADQADLFESIITYICNPGYNMEGSIDKVTCLSDGTWGLGPLPTCVPKDCGEPPPCIDKANCEFKTTTFKSKFTVSCNEGHELERDIPNTELKCGDTGEWEKPESELFACLPLKCVALPPIKHGRAVYEEVGNPTYEDKVGYECDIGYYVETVSEVMCQSDRSYTAVPECLPKSCGAPDKLENGEVDATGETFEHKTSYQCDAGYYMEGARNWICGSEGKWIVEVIKKKLFDGPIGRMAAPPSSYTTFQLQSVLSEASGGSEGSAEGSGQQSLVTVKEQPKPMKLTGRSFAVPVAMAAPTYELDRSPSCHPVSCGIPPKVANAKTHLELSLVYKESIIYQCKPGFELVGEAVLHCQANGNFGPNHPPTCVRVQCSIPEVKVNCKIDGKTAFKFEDTLIYRPVKGHEFSPSTESTSIIVTCTEDGVSSITDLPDCVPVSCNEPATPENGNMAIPDSFTYNQSISFSCIYGYKLTGSAVVTCMSNRQWSPKPPECHPVSCGSPPKLDLASMKKSNMSGVDPFTYGQQVGYTCDEGYHFKNEEADKMFVIHCLLREWSDTPTECLPVPCPELYDVTNGKLNVSGDSVFGAKAQFKCDIGYEMEGDSLLVCESTGHWSNKQPSCNPVSCDLPPHVLHSNHEETDTALTYGQTISYVCMAGYELEGSSTLTCLDDLNFDYPAPVCAPVECPSPPFLSHGRYLKNAGGFLFMSTVTYRCNYGHIMTSEEDDLQFKTIKCEANKEWSGGAPVCEIISCGDPALLENGFVDYTSTTHEAMVAYSCKPGYDIIEDSNGFEHCLDSYVCRECQANGIWGNGHSETLPPHPVCSPVSCGDPPELENGSFEATGHLYQNLAKYKCNDGYEFPSTVKKIVYDVTLQCWSNAQWGPLPLAHCQRIQCDAPQEIANGEVHVLNKITMKEGFYYEDIIIYLCEHGYMETERKNITCGADEQWDSEPPWCDPVDCGRLPGRKHGYATDVQDTTYKSVIEYGCDIGYEHVGNVGDDKITCTADGVWSKHFVPACQPIHCDFPTRIDNGFYELFYENTTYKSEVEYKCDPGYEVTGKSTLTCRADKTWRPELPICNPVPCSRPPTISNGFLISDVESPPVGRSMTLDPIFESSGREPSDHDPGGPKKRDLSSVKRHVYGDTVQYACDIGFKLVNGPDTVCNEEGKWSHVPTCNLITCEPLQAQPNSQRQGDAWSYGKQISYICDKGYVSTHNSKVSFHCTCGEDGAFEPMASAKKSKNELTICKHIAPSCERISCGIPPVVDHSLSINTEFHYQDTVNYECINGYKIKGNAEIHCNAKGGYDRSPPQCVRKSCGTPEAVDNAFSTLSSGMKFGDIVSFDCLPGYVHMKNTQRTCMGDGQWSDECVRCDPVNCTDIELHDHTKLISPYAVTYGSTLVFECEEGFNLVGKKVILCGSSTEWSSDPPVCVRVTCDPVPLVEHGIPTSTLLLPSYDDHVDFFCLVGYELTGNSSIVCQSTGIWSKPPTCTPVKCPDIPNVENSIIENIKHMAFTYGQQVSYACNFGYQIGSQTHTRTCQADGTFSDEDITCEKVPCPPVKEIQYGVASDSHAVYGEEITYACIKGYRMEGPAAIKCGILGSWSNQPPTCLPISCGSAPPVKNAEVSDEKKEYLFGGEVVYSCMEGHELIGTETQKTCLADGSFLYNNIECLPVVCKLPDIKNGVFNADEATYMNEGLFLCNTGYELSSGKDEEKSICQANASWSIDFTNIVCLPVQCPALPVFSNGDIDFVLVHLKDGESEHDRRIDGVHLFEDSANFTCHEGYHLKGTAVSSCRADGRWSPSIPVCVPVKCGIPPIIENSVPTETILTFGMIAEYQCLDGYRLATPSKSHTCLSDGTFTQEEIICERIRCPSFSSVTHGALLHNKSFVGDTNQYVCMEGYESHSTAKCLSSGLWDSELDPCQAIECDLAPVFENAKLDEDFDFVFGDVAKYTCDMGHTLTDGRKNFSISCLPDGSFPEPELGCAPVHCDLDHGVANGVLHLKKDNAVFGDSVQLTCNEGYLLSGDEEILCTETGEWYLNDAQCLSVLCGVAPKIPNAKSVLDASYIYKYTGSVKYTCVEGYELIDPEKVILCQSSGMFADTDVQLCAPTTCTTDVEIEHGSLSARTVVFGEKITLTCDAGYEIDTDVPTISVTCLAEGQWSKDVTSLACSPLICDELDPFQFGEILLHEAIQKDPSTNDSVLLYNSSIRYRCGKGYTLKGVAKQHCLPDGTWAGTRPVCNPIECGTPPFILHGTITGGEVSTYGNEISYECDLGYVLDPLESSSRTCNEMGSWTGRHPVCKIVSCGPPLPVDNAEVDSYAFTYESILGIVCDTGYYMTAGDETRTCEGSGKWSGEETQCERISCGPHADVANGVVDSPDASLYGDSVSITCNTGFALFGDETRVCESEGEWEGVEPECVFVIKKSYASNLMLYIPAECDKPIINNTKVKMVEGTEEKETYIENDVLEFCCSAGYIPTSDMKMKCLGDGTWDGEPNCIPQCRHKCKNRGRCSGKNKCTCSHGWAGSRCHKPVCKLPCLNGGFCSGPYLCQCKPGWTGTRCQTPLCTRPCKNGGKCTAPDTCYCPYGYSGSDCSEKPYFGFW